jgi:arylsulfatase A-like enzyme
MSSPGNQPPRPFLSRRGFLRATGAGAAVAALPSLRGFDAAVAAGRAQRPNIVWFRSEDNTASFIGAYGNELADTPTIDGLARDGVLYRNFFTTSPVCAPTKLAILTGIHDASLGPGHNMRAQGKIPSWLRGFATYLAGAGYWCTESGNTDYNTDIRGQSGYHDSSGNWQDRPEGSPFFALLGTNTTHETMSFTPYPGATDPSAVQLPAYHPDTEIMRRDRAHYMDQVTRMDGEVASLLQDLEDAGEADNTIFIYSSDHGGVLPRSKRFCYDSGLHAPLIIRFPKRWQHLSPGPPGSVYTAPVSSVDAPPTMLSLAGLKVPRYLHGQPFAGRAVDQRTYAFSNRNRMDQAIDFVRTVRDERYRYIRNYMPHLPYGQHVMFMWLQAGVREWEQKFLAGELDEVQARFWREKPAEELYDLQNDPDEVNNLIDAPKHRARARRMREALDEHMLRINDNGFIPEGMAAEGWDASRKPGAYPLRRLLRLGGLAIHRDAANLPQLVKALRDSNEIVRYWGAMGLSMLGAAASPAASRLSAVMTDDASPWVQAQAADALARAGGTALAVPFLGSVVADESLPIAVRLQAVWSLHYTGPDARVALPQLAIAAKGTKPGLDDYPAEAARYAIRTITGTYVPAP